MRSWRTDVATSWSLSTSTRRSRICSGSPRPRPTPATGGSSWALPAIASTSNASCGAPALRDLAPDAQIAFAGALTHARYGSVSLVRLFGTLRDGGAFESPNLTVTIVAAGRLSRLEMFELEHVDAALARFAELRPDPLRI